MSQTRSQLIVGIVTGVVGTVVGGLILAYLLPTQNPLPSAPKTPELSIVSQSVRVPPQPITYGLRSRINEEIKDATIERVLDYAAAGFVVVQYDLMNETTALLRDVEVSAPDAEVLFQSSASESVGLEKQGLKFNIPPGQKVRLVSLQRYSEPNLSATYRESYFTAVDYLEYARLQGSKIEAQRIEDRYVLVNRPLVDVIWFVCLSLAITLSLGFFPVLWRYFFQKAKDHVDEQSFAKPD